MIVGCVIARQFAGGLPFFQVCGSSDEQGTLANSNVGTLVVTATALCRGLALCAGFDLAWGHDVPAGVDGFGDTRRVFALILLAVLVTAFPACVCGFWCVSPWIPAALALFFFAPTGIATLGTAKPLFVN